jgi:hypothetical protein
MRKYAFLTLLILAFPAYAQDLFPSQAAQQAMQQAQQNAATLAMQQSEQGEGYICRPERLSLSAPRFSVKPGTYNAPRYIKIIELNRSATIYYTTDGSTPTTASPKFTLRHRAIPVVSTTRIQAIAISCDGHSPIASALFTVPAKPVPPAPRPVTPSTPSKPVS